jgi:hypothetical protein|tara:strand:+ start:4709 stop:5200 length:492 start_codon:yes stop_codon:yes gene_type:complete
MKITKRQLLKIIREEKTRLKEQTVGVEDVSQTEDAFGGGEDEGEMFVDAVADDLLNALADEVGRVDDIGKTAVEVVEDRDDSEDLEEGRTSLKRRLRRIVREQAGEAGGGLPNPTDLAKKLSAAGPEAAISFISDLTARLSFSGDSSEASVEVPPAPPVPEDA